MTFIGNTATVGSVGYLYSTSSCSWDQFEDPYFDSAQVLNWNFVQQLYVISGCIYCTTILSMFLLHSNNSNTFHNDNNSQRYNVQTEPTRIVIINESVSICNIPPVFIFQSVLLLIFRSLCIQVKRLD